VKIYTKTGDKGETGLFGGKRVSKSALRISAFGTVDELNAHLGLVSCAIVNPRVKETVAKLQNLLFSVGADLASPFEIDSKPSPIKRISDSSIEMVEKEIDFFDGQLAQLQNFILPGGTESASRLHVARAVCRRAEREVVLLSQQEEINQKIVIFLNRISDLLFVLSRFENKSADIPDTPWEKSQE